MPSTEVDETRGRIVGHLLNDGVPADLCSRFSERVPRPVSLVNDAEAWMETSGTQALCVTNHYTTAEFSCENADIEERDTVERLEFLDSKLHHTGALDSQSAFRVLSSNQLLCDGTQHQVAMSAKAGLLVARVPGEKAVKINL